MKTLHLNLKRKWFDMISSGEKKEEYREIKEHWQNRLTDCYKKDFRPCKYQKCGECIPRFEGPETVTFTNRYRKNSRRIVIELKSISIREGVTNWGAEKGKKYFVLELGKIKR